MAKTNQKHGRLVRIPKHPDTQELTLSSGYTVAVEPMPYAVYQRLRARQEELFPEPAVPMVNLEMDDGNTQQVKAGSSSAEGLQYMMDMAQVAMRRSEFVLDFMLDHYFVGMVGDEPTDVLADPAVRKNLDMLRLLEDDVPDEDDEAFWPYVLRHCVLVSRADYDMVKANILMLISPISQEEILAAGESFWRNVSGHAGAAAAARSADE